MAGVVKRSGIKRTAGLKADPEKTRAFVARGRQPKTLTREEERALVERVRANQRAAREAAQERSLKRRERDGLVVASAGPAQRQTGAQGSTDSVREVRAVLRKVVFRAKVPASEMRCGRGYACGHLRPRFRMAQSWHHWLPQRDIRRHVDALVRSRPKRELRRLLRGLLADERNLIALCRECHDAHEHTLAGRYGWADVPASAVEFAGELGVEFVVVLERLYGCPEGAASSCDPEPLT